MLWIIIYTHHFISGKRRHLYLLSCTCIGRKLYCPTVTAPCLFHSYGIPYTTYTGYDTAISYTSCKVTISFWDKSRTGCDIYKSLCNIYTFYASFCCIPVAMIRYAIIINAKIHACTAKEWIQIPAWCKFHWELLPCCLCNFQDTIHSLHIIFCKITLIIIQEISIIRCHRISIQYPIIRCCGYWFFQIGTADYIRIRYWFQCAWSNKAA